MVACSTHLVAGNPSVAGQQLAELNAFLEPYRQAGRRVYMMGDFNLDRPPYGSLDQAVRIPGGVRVAGWVTDPEQVAPIDLHAYIGPYGYNTGVANGYRADVRPAHPQQGGYHGFGVSIANTLPAGNYSTCAWGINAGGGSNATVGCTALDYQVDPIGAFGPVTVGWGFVNVKGWTIDPDTAAAVPVHVYTSSTITWGGTLGTPGAAGTNTGNASVYRADIAAWFPAWGGNHGLDANVSSPTGHKYACGYAINTAGQGGDHLLGCTQYLP